MRITITIDDEIHRQLKARAAKEATTISRLIEDSIHLTARRLNEAPGQPFKLVTFGKSRRPFGLAKGEFVVPDDFDDSLPDALLDAFEGNE